MSDKLYDEAYNACYALMTKQAGLFGAGKELIKDIGKFVWKHPVATGLPAVGYGGYRVSKALGNETPYKRKPHTILEHLDDMFVHGEHAKRNQLIAGGSAAALIAGLAGLGIHKHNKRKKQEEAMERLRQRYAAPQMQQPMPTPMMAPMPMMMPYGNPYMMYW